METLTCEEMDNPGHDGNSFRILCHCGDEVDIIEAIRDRYRRYTICNKVHIAVVIVEK